MVRPAVSAPYRPYMRFFNPMYGMADSLAYRVRNRRFNKPARRIQKAAATMARTKRYNMVRKNPMAMVQQYIAAEASRKAPPMRKRMAPIAWKKYRK